MKIFSLFILAAIPLAAQQDTPSKPGSGAPVGGYNTTIYNSQYGQDYLDPNKVDPTKELEATYPQSGYNQTDNQKDNTGVDSRTTGSDFSAAKAQAIYWLGLLDQKAYGASYMQAGGFLQDIMSSNIWIAAMKSVRGDLGNNTSRKVANHSSLNRLPHGTTGTFMQIIFNSGFSSKSSVKEKVILMAEARKGQQGSNSKGDWKVISYSIEG